MDEYEDMHPYLQDPDRRTTNVIKPEVWKTAMRKNGQYNDHIFLQLTAHWLKRDIIILPWNKNDQPLDRFVEHPITSVDSDGKYYLLYYPEAWFAQGSHYMSIMPVIPSDLYLSSQPR